LHHEYEFAYQRLKSNYQSKTSLQLSEKQTVIHKKNKQGFLGTWDIITLGKKFISKHRFFLHFCVSETGI
jgi:hypothetical protein